MAVRDFFSPTSMPWSTDTLSMPTRIFWSFLLPGSILVLLYYASYQLSRYLDPLKKLPYPPGPPSRDIISGNARDLSSNKLWLTLADWATKYGRIFHLKAFAKHMIVLNSIDDAIELLEKRSNIYSDRPYIPMVDLMGWSFGTAFKSYGPVWHAHRRVLQQKFRPNASLQYRPTQTEKVNDLLNSLLESPEDFMTHNKTLSVAIIMAVVYGYDVAPKDDHFQALADEAVSALSKSTYPGSALVNILPFLRVIPAWFPGAGFQRFALSSKAMTTRMQEVPFKYVQTGMAAGTAPPSVVGNLIETSESEEDHLVIKEVAATAYAGGADTTTAALGSFFYAMAMFPDIQKKAQEEIDRVIGTDRLPTYDDESSLPYVQALKREVLRWRPVLPLGAFHATIEEDVYNGYYIPKGSTIVNNIWAMTRDPTKYIDPEEFIPERFFKDCNELNDNEMTYTFGFGRRICPGRHMASATIWLAMATILSAFDIRVPKDDLGNDIPLDVEYSGGLISQPLPFKCIITPRSIKMKQLIGDLHKSNI